MNILIALLIFAVIAYLVYYVLGMTPLPAPIKTIVYVILAVVFIVYLLGFLPGSHSFLMIPFV